MKKKIILNENSPLPPHIKVPDGTLLNYEEIRARFICEHIFKKELINGDRPDVFDKDKTLGIEVTSASNVLCRIHKNIDNKLVPCNINYQHLEGKKLESICKSGRISEDLCFAKILANTSDYKNLIIDVLNDKLKKLNGIDCIPYTFYPSQYLYIISIVSPIEFSINDLMNLFNMMSDVQGKYHINFEGIFLEGINLFVKFNFYEKKAYFMPDIIEVLCDCSIAARKYVIAKYNGQIPPKSPGELFSDFDQFF